MSREGAERGRHKIQSRLQTQLLAQSLTQGSNSQTVRSWPEQKLDTQLTEPPRRPLVSVYFTDLLVSYLSLYLHHQLHDPVAAELMNEWINEWINECMNDFVLEIVGFDVNLHVLHSVRKLNFGSKTLEGVLRVINLHIYSITWLPVSIVVF